MQQVQQLRSVSPQAIEALKSLEQLQSLQSNKIVKRIPTNPIQQFFMNGRQITVFGNSPQKQVYLPYYHQPTFANQTDRIDINRDIQQEMQQFKRQVQENNVLLQTIISKYESSSKQSVQMNSSGTQTPTMFRRNSCEETIKQEQQDVVSNQIITTSHNLIEKKQIVLNQILQLDNEIKLLQDEETRAKLDPTIIKERTSIAPVSISDQMTENINTISSTSNFVKKLNDWIKKKTPVQQYETLFNSPKTSALRDCTQRGNLNSSSKTSVYDRNIQWQQRINLKKQLLRSQKCTGSQKSLLQTSKSPTKISKTVERQPSLDQLIKTDYKKSPQSSIKKQSKIAQLLAKKLRF